MKLYSSKTSPYARKVRVTVITLRLSERVEVVEQAPRDNSTGFFDVNPLARIPTLMTDDGIVLYDSPVIVDYLNSFAGGTLIPIAAAERWDALRRQALADGILDTALPLRGELLRVKELQSEELITRNRATIARGLNVAERDAATGDDQRFDIGTIAMACTLGWLDFRIPDLNWRATRPALTSWLQVIEQHPSLQSTRPT